MNKAYNRCLFAYLFGNSPGSRANNIYSLGSDTLTEVQLYLFGS